MAFMSQTENLIKILGYKRDFKQRNLVQLIATTVCKISDTLPLKNSFSSFQYPPYLHFQPFPLPPSLSSSQCWLFKFSAIFRISSNIDTMYLYMYIL